MAIVFRRSVPVLLVVLCLLTLGLGAPAARAEVAVVTTKDGKTFKGELVRENGNEVVLEISGIQTPIDRADIDSVQVQRSPEEEYRAKRAKIADDNYESRYKLADEMFQAGHLQIAERELESLLRAKPDYRQAQLLQLVVQERIKLQQESKRNAGQPRTAQPANNNNGNADQPSRPGRRNRTSPFQSRDDLLSADQINLIKLWELPADLARAKPRITIPRETIDKLFEKYQDREEIPKGRANRRDFRRMEDWRQLQVIFAVRARDLYPEVRVRQDPPTMLTYRRSVGPTYVDRYFFDNFGNGQVEGLALVPPGVFDGEQAAYTNFYLLSKFKNAQADMIDRQKPAQSLLLQWGLPRDSAKFPAPDVPGWRPFFNSTEDPNFQRFANWIGELYSHPDYGIDYKSPAQRAEDADSGPDSDAGSDSNSNNNDTPAGAGQTRPGQ